MVRERSFCKSFVWCCVVCLNSCDSWWCETILKLNVFSSSLIPWQLQRSCKQLEWCRPHRNLYMNHSMPLWLYETWTNKTDSVVKWKQHYCDPLEGQWMKYTHTPKNGINFDASGHLNLHWEKFWCMSRLETSLPRKRCHGPCADLSGSSGQQSWRSSLKQKSRTFIQWRTTMFSLKESLGHLDDSNDERKTALLLPNRILLYTLYIDPHYTSAQVFHCNPPLWREPSGQSLFSVPRMLGCFFFCTARFESNTWTKVGHCFKIVHQGLKWKSSMKNPPTVNNNKPKNNWWFTTPLEKYAGQNGNSNFRAKIKKCLRNHQPEKKWPRSQTFNQPQFLHFLTQNIHLHETPTKCQVSGVSPKKKQKTPRHVVETRLLGDITTVEDLLRQGIVDLIAFCGTNLPAAATHDSTPRADGLNPSCARWRHVKKKLHI